MKSHTLPLLAAFALMLCTLANAQNAVPIISNLSVAIDSAQHEAVLQFDLADADADPLDVWIRVSGDDGKTWQLPVDTVAGDIGFPISAGTGKTITWKYDVNALAVALGSGPANLVFRVTADDRVAVDIGQMVQMIDSSRMMQGLAFLQGTRHRSAGPAHHLEVRDSLSLIRDAAGLQDWNYNFSSFGYPGHNLIGRKYGLLDDAPTWYITAHYDSEINTPGVDDNATGTIAVMEAMQVLTQFEFKESIRFIAFDLEEDGLLGSTNYVLNHIEPWEDIQGVLNMEMLGYYSDVPNSQSIPFGFSLFFPAAYAQVEADSFRGNFLTNVSNTNSEWLMRELDTCATLYAPGLRVVGISTPATGLATPDLRRSDHAPFWDAGYPALMLTDGANQRNGNYHQPGDSLSTITPQFYIRSAKAVISTLIKLAQPIHATSALSTATPINLPVGMPVLQPADVQIFPNPNDGQCQIEIQLPSTGPLKVSIQNGLGQHVATLFNGDAPGGKMMMKWDGRQEPAGTYFIQIEHSGRQLTFKNIVTR